MGGEFIDFVEVDNAHFCEADIACGFANEVTDEVINVCTDVACFAEFGGVGFDERDADEFCCGADEVGFADACGAEEENVLFLVEWGGFALEGEADVLVVVAEGDAEDFFCFVLADDEAVEVCGDVGWFKVEEPGVGFFCE